MHINRDEVSFSERSVSTDLKVLLHVNKFDVLNTCVCADTILCGG